MPDFSTLQTVSGQTDFVFSNDGKVAYITTSGGDLLRWDVEGQQFLSPITLGGPLSSVDISPDGSYLMVGRSDVTTVTQTGTWWDYVGYTVLDRVSTSTFAVTALNMSVTGMDAGVAHIALVGDNEALLDQNFNGSGWVALRMFSALASTVPDTTAPGLPSVRQNSYLITSADNRYVFVQEANISSGPMHIFDAQTNTRIASRDFYSLGNYGAFNSGRGDINAGKQLVANVQGNQIFVLDFNLDLVKLLDTSQLGGAIGAEFTLDGEHLLVWRADQAALTVFDTRSWSNVGSVALQTSSTGIGASSPFGQTDLAGDGRMLFLDTQNGFALVDLQSSLTIDITGASTADILRGSVGADRLDGGDGADTLYGAEWNDTLTGGAGDDVLDGGSGSDTAAYANAGSAVTVNLSLAGSQNTLGAGQDTLVSIENLTGSVFNDLLTGNGFGNILSGGAGDDTLDGGGSDDISSYASATSAVTVSLMLSGPQNTGGAGIDTLIAIEGLTGSDFNDTLEGGAGDSVLAGGLGEDWVSYARASAGVVVDLAKQGDIQNTGGSGQDVLTGFEHLEGSAFGDQLDGDAGSNQIRGGAGADTLHGHAGSDILDGGAGDDGLYGGDGTDTATYAGAIGGVAVSLAVQGAQNTGGAGNDVLSEIEDLIGSDFGDTLTGNAVANVIAGGAGADVIDGGQGDDRLEGGAGDDVLNGGDGVDTADYNRALGGITVSLANPAAQNTGGAGLDTLSQIENLVGSAFADALTGSASANVVAGGQGADVIDGGQGDDVLDGGEGADVIDGGDDSDTISGGAGNDVLSGGSGDDLIDGGLGDDTLDGGGGVDTATYATAEGGVSVSLSTPAPSSNSTVVNDTLAGIENLIGTAFSDVLKGDAGANGLSGGAGADSLFGEDGNDTLRGEAGQDNLMGGMGDDLLDGGGDNDFANYSDIGYFTSGNGQGVTVTLGLVGAQDTIGAGVDTLVSIEYLTGSQYGDTLTGDQNANIIYGQNGGDVIYGGAGNDQLYGQDGDDVIEGGAGQDVLDGGAGSDTVSYSNSSNGVSISLASPGWVNTGGNVFDNLANFENLTGTAFGDTLSGNTGDNVLNGLDGRDFLIGGAGADILIGGDGVDDAVYTTATGSVTVSLAIAGTQDTRGAGWDTLIGIEGLTGGGFNDVLTGDTGDNRLSGGGGDDLLDGGAGADLLDGGAGVDTATYRWATGGVAVDLTLTGSQATGGAGNDVVRFVENLIGSGYDDYLTGSALDNALDGGDGSDILVGAAGNDILRDGGETSNRDFLYGGAGNDTYYVSSSLTGPADLVYEGSAVAGAEAGVGDFDIIHSGGEFFWDYYGVAEELHVDRAAGSQIVGGTNGQTFFGNVGTDIMLVYGGSNRVDAGAGTDAIGLGLYGLDESYDGASTIVMKAGSGMDYVYDFESGVDKIDLSAFHFGITGAQVLAQAINVDNAGTDNDYSFFYLTSAGGVDNFVVFMGLLSSQLQASDFITGTV